MPGAVAFVNSCRHNGALRKGEKLKKKEFGSCVCEDDTACANAGNPDDIKNVGGHPMMMCGRAGTRVTQSFASTCRNRTHIGP